MVYKLHINSFITTYQKTILNNQNGQVVPQNQPVINTAAETAEAANTTIADELPRRAVQEPQAAAPAQAQEQ